MGRMLDALKQGSKLHAEQCVVDWTLREPEEIPYIEVGSGKKIEGSATVMAVKHPPQPALQPPHPPTEKSLATPTSTTIVAQAPSSPTLSELSLRVKQDTVILTETKPLAVAFEPWPTLVTPSRGIAPEVIAFHQPDHVISRQYAALLGKILEGQNGAGTKALLVSGCKPHVGTTSALLNLAVVAALQDKRRLVLVDAHFLRPALAQRLGITAPAGLQEVLAGAAALESAVVKSPIAGMYLLAARGEDNALVGQLNVDALTWVLTLLKERFDLVLLDGPGMEEGADITALAPVCDGMYLVVPQEEEAPQYRAIAHNIGRHGGRLMGLIRTKNEQ
jgi:Mrp family chromosome partitioning ATPase